MQNRALRLTLIFRQLRALWHGGARFVDKTSIKNIFTNFERCRAYRWVQKRWSRI